MKEWFRKPSNLITLLILTFVVWKQLPIIVNSIQKTGFELKASQYQVIRPDSIEEKILFPPANKSIAIFWATWCGPCKLEMNRLKSSVENGNIPQKSIYAINPFESTMVISKFLAANSYPFIFIEAQELSSKLKIEATPTTIFIEKEKVTSMSTGISLIGIWKAEAFF